MNSELESISQFLLAAPLYSEFEFNPQSQIIRGFFRGRFPVDGFCPRCAKDTTYRLETFDADGDIPLREAFSPTQRGMSLPKEISLENSGESKCIMVCSRAQFHVVRFILDRNHHKLKKIGQFPSVADLTKDESKLFSKYLDEQDRMEFSRAVGLASHGIGIGSYVYLRRLFERLVKKNFVLEKEKLGLSDQDFGQMRMGEKISALKEFLPPELYEFRDAYGLLSQGLHELTDEACLAEFAVLKASILAILESEVEKAKREERRKELAQALSSTKERLSRKN